MDLVFVGLASNFWKVKQMVLNFRSVRPVLFVLIVTLVSRPIQGQTSPFEPPSGNPPSTNPLFDFPDSTSQRERQDARQKAFRSKFPALKLIELKMPALTEAQLQPDPQDDEVMQIAKQKAATLRELIQVYRDKLEGDIHLFDEIAKAEREYASTAFEILKSDEGKLNALYHSLNASIQLENIAADRAGAGGPPEAHLGAKAHRLEAQLRIAKFKRTMSTSQKKQERAQPKNATTSPPSSTTPSK